jgi:hypothetical protein
MQKLKYFVTVLLSHYKYGVSSYYNFCIIENHAQSEISLRKMSRKKQLTKALIRSPVRPYSLLRYTNVWPMEGHSLPTQDNTTQNNTSQNRESSVRMVSALVISVKTSVIIKLCLYLCLSSSNIQALLLEKRPAEIQRASHASVLLSFGPFVLLPPFSRFNLKCNVPRYFSFVASVNRSTYF